MCTTHTSQLFQRGGGSSSSKQQQLRCTDYARGTEKQDEWSEENATCKTHFKNKKSLQTNIAS